MAAALLLQIALWPLLADMIAANDDLKFVRGSEAAGSVAAGTLSHRLAEAWRTKSSFRPLELAVGSWCDPATLACGWAIVVQLAGLTALCAGAAALARRALPAHRIAVPLLLVWLALSPATTGSVWQVDTCSQTWCAALAAWAGVLAWDSLLAARTGRVAWARIAALAGIFVIGCTLKEIFYGWSFGIGLALIAAIALEWRRDRAGALRAAWTLLPCVVVPLMHLAIRLKFSALGGVAAGTAGDDRYKMELGENLVLNSMLSLASVLADGPLHLIGDSEASLLLRALPFASLVAALLLIGLALGFLAYHRRAASGIAWRPIAACAFAGVASMAITLPMDSVSDLYALGANVGSGLVVVACLVSLWGPVAADEVLLCRSVALVTAACVALVGVYGLASRAYNFRLTWHYTATGNANLLAMQDALPPSAGRPVVLYFSTDCMAKHFYGQVVVSPIQSLDLPDTIDWMNARDPTRPINWSPQGYVRDDGRPHPVFSCADFPVRLHR